MSYYSLGLKLRKVRQEYYFWYWVPKGTMAGTLRLGSFSVNSELDRRQNVIGLEFPRLCARYNVHVTHIIIPFFRENTDVWGS